MENLLSEGLTLLVYGMGFVFVFLTLLVGTTSLMSKLVSRYAPAPQPKASKARSAAPAAAATSTAKNDELIAVMTAAVHKFRS